MKQLSTEDRSLLEGLYECIVVLGIVVQIYYILNVNVYVNFFKKSNSKFE